MTKTINQAERDCKQGLIKGFELRMVPKQDMQILVLQAFDKGLTLGQFLRSLPGSSKMSKEELQEYSKVYVEMRNSAVTE